MTSKSSEPNNPLKNLQINRRILAGTLLLVLLMVLVALSGYFGLDRVKKSNDIVLARRDEVAQVRMLQLILKSMYVYQTDYMLNIDPVSAQAFRNSAVSLRNYRSRIEQAVETDDERLIMKIINNQTDAYTDLFLLQIVPAVINNEQEEMERLSAQSDELVAQMDPFIQNLIASFDSKANLAYQNAQKLQAQTILSVVSLTLIAVVSGLISGIYLARSISRTTREVILTSEKMRKAEEELNQSQAVFRHVVQAAPWGMHFYQIDEHGQLILTDINPASETILSKNIQKDIGNPISDILVDWNFPERVPFYKKIAIEGGNWESEKIYENYGDIRLALNVHAFQIAPGKMVAAFTDITERKRIEREREEFIHELDRKNKELESIIYATSHDLRSPLLNIIGFGRLLQTASQELITRSRELERNLSEDQRFITPLEERINQTLYFINTSASKMDVLINGLLRLSRLGRAALLINTLDMNELMKNVLDSMQYLITHTEADITVDDLPACRGDSDQINQVFTNLLDNAIKYRDPHRSLKIAVYGHPEGQQIVYCVEDNGIGIPQEHQDKIWELFHRLNPRGEVAGEGLGLTLVLRILDRNNGHAWVESTPGEGSKFYISLPAVQMEPSKDQ